MIRALVLVLAAALAVSAVAAADAFDPKTKLSKADQARAKASALSFADLGPAWTGRSETPVSLKIPSCPANQPNNSDLTLTGHAESVVQLPSEGLQVDTDVEIFGSSGQVDRLFARILRPALGQCLQYSLLKSVGRTAKIGKVTSLALAKAGSHSAGFRIAVTYKGLRIISDYLFVSQGRTQFFVNLVAPGTDEGQLPQLENRIAKTLAGHAKV